MWPIVWVVSCFEQLYFQAKRRMGSFVVHHKVSGSNIWRTDCPRITKFCTASMPTYLKAARIYYIIYAGTQLWKFEKTVHSPAYDGIGSNCSGAAFCLPHQPAVVESIITPGVFKTNNKKRHLLI